MGNINFTVSRPIVRSKNSLILIAAIVFSVLNALKITLFNYYLLSKQTAGIFKYKFVMTLLLIVIIYPAIYKLRFRVVLIAAYTLQTVYMAVNVSYFLYFHSYLHILQSLALFREGFAVAGNSAAPLSPKMLIVFIDLPFFIILLIKRFSPAFGIKLRTAVRIAMAAAFLAIVSIELWNFGHNNSIFNLVNDTFSGESPIVERYGTVADNVVNLCYNGSNEALVSHLKYGRDITVLAQSGNARAAGQENGILPSFSESRSAESQVEGTQSTERQSTGSQFAGSQPAGPQYMVASSR